MANETKYFNVTYKFRTQTSPNMRTAQMVIGATDVKEASKLATDSLKGEGHPWFQLTKIVDTGTAQTKLF